MTTEKTANAVAKAIERIAASASHLPGEALPDARSTLADTERALKRIAKRAETQPAEYERVELVQSRGPSIEFTGRLLAETEFVTKGREPLRIALEIWETEAGALIAATYRRPDGAPQDDDQMEAVVVERSDDAQAMRFAVLDAFEWDLRARSMCRKLGWSFRLDVA